jgi:hypothetical protein
MRHKPYFPIAAVRGDAAKLSDKLRSGINATNEAAAPVTLTPHRGSLPEAPMKRDGEPKGRASLHL